MIDVLNTIDTRSTLANILAAVAEPDIDASLPKLAVAVITKPTGTPHPQGQDDTREGEGDQEQC